MNKWQKEVQESLLKSESEVVKALERQYKNALKEINSKISAFEQSISDLNDAIDSAADMQELQRLRSVKQSKVYQKQYQEALRGQVSSILDKMHSDQFTTIDAYLKGCYDTSYIGTMYDVSRQGLPIIQPINQAAVTKAILTDSKVQGGYYKALGVNVTKLKKTITAEISRGIASGMRYSDIARNIDSVAKTGFNNAYRIARTEGHRITQSAAYDAQKVIADKGIEILRQWDAVLDGRTRPSHRLLDGQIVGVDEDFTYNGKKVQKPGSFGLPEEDINCRCIVTTRIPEDLDEEELETLKKRAEFFGIDKSDSFKDFAEKYLKAVAKAEKPKFVPAKTIEEAKQYLADIIADNVDFGKMTIDQINGAASAITEMHNEFPSLRIDTIGTSKRKNTIAQASGNTLKFNASHFGAVEGSKNFDLNIVFAKSKIAQLREQLDTGIMYGRKIAPQMRKKLESELARNEYIVKFKRFSTYVTSSKEDRYRYGVFHEFGHIVSDRYLGMLNGSAYCPYYGTYTEDGNKAKELIALNKSCYKKAVEDGTIFDVGKYGSTDEYEFFSEVFCMHYAGETLPDYIEEMIREVISFAKVH